MPWDRLSRIAQVAGYFATAAGVVVVGSAALGILDPIRPVTRGYLEERETEANKARSEIVYVVIELARDRKAIITRERDSYILQMSNATDLQTKTLLKALIDASAQDIVDVDARISTLERIRTIGTHGK